MNVLVTVRLSEQSCFVHKRFRFVYLMHTLEPDMETESMNGERRWGGSGLDFFFFLPLILAPKLSTAAFGKQRETMW